MNSKKGWIALVLLAAMGFYACDSINKVTGLGKKDAPVSSVAPPKTVSVLSGKWRLNYVTGPRISFEGLYPNNKPTLILDSSKLQASGNTGCNNFTGAIAIVGDSIHFKGIATTMANCTDGGQGETVFLGMLDKVSHYRVAKDTLWFRFKKITAMRFVRDTTSLP